MTDKQLYKRLKNNKDIWLTKSQPDGSLLNVNLRFEKLQFIIYSYIFDGNDEWDPEENKELKDEQKFTFTDFDSTLNYLNHRLPDWKTLITLK